VPPPNCSGRLPTLACRPASVLAMATGRQKIGRRDESSPQLLPI
jgi:hypothetical protein